MLLLAIPNIQEICIKIICNMEIIIVRKNQIQFSRLSYSGVSQMLATVVSQLVD